MDDVHPIPSTFQEMDDASAALILQLQQEDADELQRTSKGKGREDELSDAEFAIQLFQQDLQQMSTLLADCSMSRSLTRAIIADAAILTDAVAREDLIANDRLVAEQLSNGGEIKSRKYVPSEDTQMNDLLLARLTALPAPSARPTPMMAIVRRTPQRSKCLQQHWNRDGNGVTIADDWSNWT
ncbi:MAG: hypothetical protein Q9209_005030 [Squamulea sp. 1 TL-2023]